MFNPAKLVIMLLLACPMLWGQDAPESKMFFIKHRDPVDIAKILTGICAATTVVTPNVMDEIKTVSVRGWKLNFDALDTVIQNLDVPQPEAKTVDLRIDVIWASQKEIPGDPVSPGLSDVIASLSKTLNYKHYREAATFTARIASGGRAVHGGGAVAMPGQNYKNSHSFSWKINNPRVDADSGTFIAEFDMDYCLSAVRNASVNIDIGDQVVIGTTAASEGLGMIMVLSVGLT